MSDRSSVRDSNYLFRQLVQEKSVKLFQEDSLLLFANFAISPNISLMVLVVFVSVCPR